MTRELACPGCGGNRLSLRYSVADSSEVWCLDCSHSLGSRGDLRRAMVARLFGPEQDFGD